ncbi:MAG: response regulator transcription factor [Bacteroidetes bacterium]|nr:response regulator transcription factor [Bacteroidota bacterium]
MAIKVMIADDHKLFRRGMVAILNQCDDIELVGEAGDGDEAIKLAQIREPDVLLLDLNMPIKTGYEVLRELRAVNSKCKVVIVSMLSNSDSIVRAISDGASGYVTKEAEPEEILTAIRSVYKNNFYFNEQTNDAMLRSITNKRVGAPAEPSEVHFNEKELAIIQKMIDGRNNVEIASELFISQRTVENIRWQMMKKVGVNSVVGLIIYAIKHNMVHV